MTQKDFCRRFGAEVIKQVGPVDEETAKRVATAARNCWNGYRRDDGPEKCAETYVNYEE